MRSDTDAESRERERVGGLTEAGNQSRLLDDRHLAPALDLRLIDSGEVSWESGVRDGWLSIQTWFEEQETGRLAHEIASESWRPHRDSTRTGIQFTRVFRAA